MAELPILTLEELTTVRQVLGTRLHYIVDSMAKELKKHPDVRQRKWYTDREAHQHKVEKAITKINLLIQIAREAEHAQD